MAIARCYECPTCGGLVRETERLCHYCGSPVATIRCGKCFMMNVTEALHCIGCGSALGLFPASNEASSDWMCPRCRTHRLDALTSFDGILHDCSLCGGQFVPHHVLDEMIKRYQALDVALPRRLRPHNPLDEKVVYLPCPACQALMLRQNFGKVSGVIVDNCANHGAWFDIGELPRVLSFVAHGGINQSTVFEKVENPSLAPLHASPTASWSEFGGSPEDALSWQDMCKAAGSFVKWVKDMLRDG
jgi:Zn-finger nucleic acid-binding protein